MHGFFVFHDSKWNISFFNCLIDEKVNNLNISSDNTLSKQSLAINILYFIYSKSKYISKIYKTFSPAAIENSFSKKYKTEKIFKKISTI